METADRNFLVGRRSDQRPRLVVSAPVLAAYGAVEGRIQTLSNRGSLRFTMYDTIHDRATACYLSRDMQDQLRGLWGHRAMVEGMVTRDGTSGRPLAVREITGITPLPEEDPVAWRQAIGAVPVGPGGLAPEDAIRRIRDAW